MFVSVGAILNLRRMLGWDNQSLALQEGSKLRDVLKSIKIPGKGSAFEYMVDKEGHLDDHYQLYLNERQVSDTMLDSEVHDHDRLVMMDTFTLPSHSFLTV